MRIWGSSPLTQGKLQATHARRARGRLIPAHAGKTTRLAHLTFPLRAHPRSCGENAARIEVRDWPAGSSPLMRGKRDGLAAAVGAAGLIPTHAGKTSASARTTRRGRAHPRSCGENTHGGSQFSAITGSSPLTRGKPHRHRVQRHEGGLIPTHAGKTVGAGDLVGHGGLIPTHAGKTRQDRASYEAWWVHPHSRGENISSTLSTSPPGAHPHSRGENHGPASGVDHDSGSSPLTRGKRGRDSGGRRHGGLIPTHAGKT